MASKLCKRSETAFWVTVIAIALCCIAVARADGQEPTNREPYKSLVELRDAGGQGTSTLVYVRPGTDFGVLLTARHVAEKPHKQMQANWIWAQAGKHPAMTYCIVSGSEFSTDMGLVVTHVPAGIKPVQVVPFDNAAGPWTAAGYRDEALRVNGPVFQVRHTSDGKIIFDEEFIPGQSGGFVCNRFGQVVGVIVAKGGGIGVASDGQTLQELIRRQLPE